MPKPHKPDSETPHDILAAEEFGIGAAAPPAERELAHDVLAAEEFGVPAGTPHALPPGFAPAASRSTTPTVPVLGALALILALVWRARRSA